MAHFWVVLPRFGSLGIVLARYGSFSLVMDRFARFGSFCVILADSIV